MKTISLAQARNQLFIITILFVLPLIAGIIAC